MKLRLSVAVAALCGGVVSHLALAQAISPERAFGAVESVQSPDLSPDGTMMSYLAPRAAGGNALYVVPVDGSAPPKSLLAASGDPDVFQSCSWVAKTRLICTIGALGRASGYVVGASRIIALDSDGTNIKVVTKRDDVRATYANTFGGRVVDLLPNEDGSVLMLNWNVPKDGAGTLVRNDKQGYSLDHVDTRTLRAKPLTPASVESGEYITDGLGTVRIMGVSRFTGDYTRTGVIRYKYKTKVGGNWLDLSEYDTTTDSGFNPFAIDPAQDIVYGFQKHQGRFALFTRSLGDRPQETLLFSRPDVDVDELIYLGRKRRVIGVSYATEQRSAVYFDDALVKLRTSLSKALPGAPLIGYEGASDDEQKLLLRASSDKDPGTLYLLDRATKQMRPLMLVRPELQGYTLAEVRSVQVRAGDGTMIPAYLTSPPGSAGKNLPAIVMPHGGPESRDEWGFDWLAQYFAHQGFVVLQPNFRGSAGYGEAWFMNNGYQSWRTAIGDVSDAGRWLVAQGIADPKRLAILGWSYGGYAALQSGATAPDLFKAIVAIAPVTDLAAHRDRDSAGDSRARLRRLRIGTGPHVTEGSPYRNADRFAAPVMLFHGDLDQNVMVNQSKMMEEALKARGKSVQLVLYPGLAHSLARADARADMLGKSNAFLRASLGMQ